MKLQRPNNSFEGLIEEREKKERKKKMAMGCKVSFGVYAMFGFVFAILLPSVQAQPLAPAPAPASSDGTTIDLGIACGLMLLALILTYLIHTFDAPLNV